MYLVTGCSKPIIRQWKSAQKINQNQKKKLITKNEFFKPVEMFYHPVDGGTKKQ